MRTILTGRDFKDMVRAVRRFPCASTYAGAGVVGLSAEQGSLTAVHYGMALTKVQVPAKGALPMISIDAKVLDGYASVPADKSKVYLEHDGNELSMRSRRTVRTAASAWDLGEKKLPSLKGLHCVVVSDVVASRVSYLSKVAHSDTSRAELCCVMMTQDGKILACSQKIIAALDGEKSSENVAVPLILAENLQAGDAIYPGAKETLLRTAIATYAMPAPAKAQQDFPVAKILGFGESAKETLALVLGEKLIAALKDCETCLSRLTPVEIVVDLELAEDRKLHVSATNGGTVFQATVPVEEWTCAGKFRAPLDDLLALTPFMACAVMLARGERGDLFVTVGAGWFWFPAWVDVRKKKK